MHDAETPSTSSDTHNNRLHLNVTSLRMLSQERISVYDRNAAQEYKLELHKKTIFKEHCKEMANKQKYHPASPLF